MILNLLLFFHPSGNRDSMVPARLSVMALGIVDKNHIVHLMLFHNWVRFPV